MHISTLSSPLFLSLFISLLLFSLHFSSPLFSSHLQYFSCCQVRSTGALLWHGGSKTHRWEASRCVGIWSFLFHCIASFYWTTCFVESHHPALHAVYSTLQCFALHNCAFHNILLHYTTSHHSTSYHATHRFYAQSSHSSIEQSVTSLQITPHYIPHTTTCSYPTTRH